MSKIVVTWPESQILFDCEDYKKHCKLINGEKGLDCYGSSAYLVDEDWWEGDIEPIDDYEDDDELEHCSDYEILNLGFLSEDDFDDEDDDDCDDEDDDEWDD